MIVTQIKDNHKCSHGKQNNDHILTDYQEQES